MRKIYLLLLVAAITLCNSINAQIVGSRSEGFTKVSTPSNTIWIVRAGMNINGFAGSGAKSVYGNGDLGSKIGYEVSSGFNKTIGGAGAYWGMEFGLGSRGFSYQEPDEDDGSKGDYSTSLFAHNVQLTPFIFGWKYSVTQNIKLDAHLGAYALYDYAGFFISTRFYRCKRCLGTVHE